MSLRTWGIQDSRREMRTLHRNSRSQVDSLIELPLLPSPVNNERCSFTRILADRRSLSLVGCHSVDWLRGQCIASSKRSQRREGLVDAPSQVSGTSDGRDCRSSPIVSTIESLIVQCASSGRKRVLGKLCRYLVALCALCLYDHNARHRNCHGILWRQRIAVFQHYVSGRGKARWRHCQERLQCPQTGWHLWKVPDSVACWSFGHALGKRAEDICSRQSLSYSSCVSNCDVLPCPVKTVVEGETANCAIPQQGQLKVARICDIALFCGKGKLEYILLPIPQIYTRRPSSQSIGWYLTTDFWFSLGRSIRSEDRVDPSRRLTWR
jgi:hypothetical protein